MIQDNLPNLDGESINVNNMLSSFDARNDLIDKLLSSELYNHKVYKDLNDEDEDENTIKKNLLFNVIDESTVFDLSNIDKLETIDISNISMSYNKVSDLYRNQKAVEKYVETNKNKFKHRNKNLLQNVDSRIRQNQIFTYYYKKYNAQKKILFNIILASILTIILIYMNKKFSFVFNDTIFVISLGITFAFFFINISIQLVEIFFRNNINYDEYDFLLQNTRNSNLNKYSNEGSLQSSEAENKKEKCKSEIKAYEGR